MEWFSELFRELMREKKTKVFLKFLFGMGEVIVQGMGKGMDWGIKKVILKSEYWFFLNFYLEWVREWFDE